MNKKILTTAITLSVSLAGCAQMAWNKDGATEQEFKVDKYACEKDARQSGYFGNGMYGAMNMQDFFKECMESKGYSLVRANAPDTYVTGPSVPLSPTPNSTRACERVNVPCQ